jgi:DNA-binding transcriptional regulator YdaS (Cro superfamily)
MFGVDDGSKLPRKTKQPPLRPIAPYSRTSKEASAHAFDRDTGKPIPADRLKTYAQALAQYHLRPETKFENGDYCDSGPTRRRHVQATQINYIGKEANRWEEQFFLGMDEHTLIEYGADPNAPALFHELTNAVGKFGKQQVASRIGISRNSLAQILDIKCQKLSPRMSQKIGSAITALNSNSLDQENQNSKLLELVRVEIADIGLSEFARRFQIDVSNLNKVMDGTRKLSRQLAGRFERYFATTSRASLHGIDETKPKIE